MEKLDNILETKDELETILEPQEEVKEVKKPAKKAVKKAKPVAIPMEDMQAHYEDRVRNNIDIMTIPYTKAYEMIRGYAASVMFSGVTYSFRVGFATPILKEHYQLVFD